MLSYKNFVPRVVAVGIQVSRRPLYSTSPFTPVHPRLRFSPKDRLLSFVGIRELWPFCPKQCDKTGLRFSSKFSRQTWESNAALQPSGGGDRSATARLPVNSRTRGIKSPPVQVSSVEEEGEEGEVDPRALLEMEVEFLRQSGMDPVPNDISPTQWEELLNRKSISSRKKYLRYLFKNEKHRENQKMKKQKAKEYRDEVRKNFSCVDENGHIRYGLWCNSLYMKINRQSMNKLYRNQMKNAILYGQPLVLDLSFDEHMTAMERQRCAFQLQMIYGENRTRADPFYIHLCSAHQSADTMKKLQRFLPGIHEPDFPMSISSESYLKAFPRDRLVYLTPNAREEMTEYDHDAVYIIGGIVDKGDEEPLTFAKARRQKLKMLKFPLDRYLEWGLGRKSLTLDQVVRILEDMKETGDWNVAFQNIPKRKLRPPPTQEELENSFRIDYHRRRR